MSTENAKKDYELREKVSERERLYIESHYFDGFTGDLEKERQTLELSTQMYPRDSVARNNLGVVLSKVGQHDRAPCTVRLFASPDAQYYANLAYAYIARIGWKKPRP